MTVEQLINVLTAFKPDTEIHARLVGNFYHPIEKVGLDMSRRKVYIQVNVDVEE